MFFLSLNTSARSQGHIEAVIMMMLKCQFHWWRKPEHPGKNTDLRQVGLTAKNNFHTYMAHCNGIGFMAFCILPRPHNCMGMGHGN